MLNQIHQSECSIEELLTKKSRIKFRMEKGSLWYTTTVESASKNEITLAFPEIFTATEIMVGNAMQCRFTDERLEYNFAGEICDIKAFFPQHISIRIYGEIQRFENVRQAKRENVILLANLFPYGTAKVVHSCVCDISSTGMMAVSRHSINETKDVEVHISLPFRNIFDSTVELKGKIMWSKAQCNQNEYGISITEIGDVYKERLNLFLEKCMR